MGIPSGRRGVASEAGKHPFGRFERSTDRVVEGTRGPLCSGDTTPVCGNPATRQTALPWLVPVGNYRLLWSLGSR